MDRTSTSSLVSQNLAEAEDTLDAAILDVLITEHPALFAHDELIRHFSEPGSRSNCEDIGDALARLVADGLIHRHDNFYFATRTVIQARRLTL